MGAGKTAFTVALCRALGVSESDAVSSPTFTLVHSYASGRVPVVHADLYRLTSMGEIEDLGLREQADMGAVVLVEWGDVAGSLLGDTLTLTLHHDDEDEDARTIEFSVEGHQWDMRWDRLRQALSRWSVS
jgi:tRNA threonylcarbamoyladenosine biosynthesis protein TsaE